MATVAGSRNQKLKDDIKLLVNHIIQCHGLPPQMKFNVSKDETKFYILPTEEHTKMFSLQQLKTEIEERYESTIARLLLVILDVFPLVICFYFFCF